MIWRGGQWLFDRYKNSESVSWLTVWSRKSSCGATHTTPTDPPRADIRPPITPALWSDGPPSTNGIAPLRTTSPTVLTSLIEKNRIEDLICWVHRKFAPSRHVSHGEGFEMRAAKAQVTWYKGIVCDRRGGKMWWGRMYLVCASSYGRAGDMSPMSNMATFEIKLKDDYTCNMRSSLMDRRT